jgi:hypothetical protein
MRQRQVTALGNAVMDGKECRQTIDHTEEEEERALCLPRQAVADRPCRGKGGGGRFRATGASAHTRTASTSSGSLNGRLH